MIGHIAKRIGLIVMGYVAALAASAILVWGSVMSGGPTSFYVPRAPSVLPPEYEALIVTLVIMFLYSFLPALILILAAEAFHLRRVWVYLVGSVLVLAGVTFAMAIPISAIESWAATLSALLGGLIYWAIAGRHAGGPMKGVTP